MRSNFRRWLYMLIVLLTVIAILYLSGWIYRVAQAGSDVLALYFFAWLIQFFFTPVVDFLQCRGVPRLAGVSLVYLALGVSFAIIVAASAPAIYSQGERLAGELANPRTYTVISNATRGIESLVEKQFHVPPRQIDAFTKGYSVSLQNGAVKAGAQLQDLIKSRLTPASLSNSASTFLTFLAALNSFLLNTVIVLLLAFYMMLDGHRLVREALAYFPPAVDEVMESVRLTVNRKFGGYLRGQLIIALSYGFLTYIVSLGFGLSYALLIAIVSAVFMLIPFVGAFAAVVPPLAGFVLAHVSSPMFPGVRLLLLLLILAVMQHIVINLLAPRVMSSAMDMHPLLVILGLVLGAKVAGIWGAIFGVPVLGVLLDTVDHIYRYIMEHRYGFHPAAPPESHDVRHPRRGPRPPGTAIRRLAPRPTPVDRSKIRRLK